MSRYKLKASETISHKDFDQNHNGYVFQTKDMGCDMSEYCVFNGVLYQQVGGSGEHKRHDYAIEMDYTGEMNIYTNIIDDDIEYWVEYDLIFNSGKLIDVIPYAVKVTKDNRDLSSFRPAKPSNRVEVTISVSCCDREKQDAFVETIDDQKLAAIRTILGEAKATIFYPAIRKQYRLLMSYPRIQTIASVVQTLDDCEA